MAGLMPSALVRSRLKDGNHIAEENAQAPQARTRPGPPELGKPQRKLLQHADSNKLLRTLKDKLLVTFDINL